MKKVWAVVLAALMTLSFGLLAAAETLPEQDWQVSAVFPDWKGNVDDTLAMNSICSFDYFSGQGYAYVTLNEQVKGFRLFVNNSEIDTTSMKPGETYRMDISDYTINGINTIQVTNIKPADLAEAVSVYVPYPGVIEGTLEDVGMNPAAFDVIDSIIHHDVENGFPSAQLAVIKDGKMVYSKAWGTTNAYNPDGTPKTDSPAVTTDTLYDLASNTKMYTANYALQYMLSRDEYDIALTDPITKFLPDFADNLLEIHYDTKDGTGAPDMETAKAWKQSLTIADVLQHQAGFAPSHKFYLDKFDQSTQKADPNVDNILFTHDKQETRDAICRLPLVYEPGTKTIYSDIDYMLLGLVIEQASGQELDVFLKENIYQPLGLEHVTYKPLENGFKPDDCAATELDGNKRNGAVDFPNMRDGTLQGQVHDEKAYYCMSEVSGHAGLFASAEDLAKLANVMLTGGEDGVKLFKKNVMDDFTKRKATSATWGLGWWRNAECGRPWTFGIQAPRGTIGHQGWTGTVTMIDDENDLVVVYLTNKKNSPITDKDENKNKSDGDWFTASTLGFVNTLIYQGMDEAEKDIQPALDALTGSMFADKMRLVNKQNEKAPVTAEHPIVRAAYALADVVFDAAEQRPTEQNIQMAEEVIELLDAQRDSERIEMLTQRLEQITENKAA